MRSKITTLATVFVLITLTCAVEMNGDEDFSLDQAAFNDIDTIFTGAWNLLSPSLAPTLEEIDELLAFTLDDEATTVGPEHNARRPLPTSVPNASEGIVALTGTQFIPAEANQERLGYSGFIQSQGVINAEIHSNINPSLQHLPLLDLGYPEVLSTSPRAKSEPRSGPGHRPHRCDHTGCSVSCATLTDLRHHRRCHTPMHRRPHGCPRCPRRFLYPRELARHMPTHGSEYSLQRFICPDAECSYAIRGFLRRDHLIRHVRARHRDLLPSVMHVRRLDT